MLIKKDTIIETTDRTFRVIGKCKSSIVREENTGFEYDFKSSGLTLYRCEDIKTHEIFAVPLVEPRKRKKRKRRIK